MKICFKDDCYQTAIPRGKYCENHSKSRKKKIEKENKEVKNEVKNIIESNKKEMIKTKDIQKINELLEERKLRAEQEEEYQMTMLADRERINKKKEEDEINEILEISKKMFIEEKRSKIQEESENDYYTIQIKLPAGNNIKRKFSQNSSFLDIRNFLDIYFHDNNINIINYDLITFPKITFTIENNNDTLSNHNLSKNLTFFIYNLD